VNGGLVHLKRTKEIALAFPRGAHQEVFIEGILQYANTNDCKWSYIIAPEWNAVSILHLVGWPGDGVIAALNTTKEAKVAETFPLPMVNISGVLVKSPVPRSSVDNRAIGVLAAEHLIDRGFQSFAYYGMKDVEYSRQRMLGFQEKLAEFGYKTGSLTVPSTFGMQGNFWLRQQRDLTEWISKLALPCGLFAASDARARQAINACQELGIKVPEQIAVLGVDDQQIICEHSHPTISSVARNNIREGYLAAQLLDRLMKKRKVSEGDQLTSPLGIVARESTATLAISDERLRGALSYFQENIEEPVTVAEMCAHVGVSRRWLEYAFRSMLGETPFNYMRRQRLEKARRLLSNEPGTKINRIARRSGYTSANQLAKAFRREFGESPRDFRKSTQG
jgi:LacI family transcriptional regulator